jgi:peptide/nickel transport system permease protein
MKGAAAKLTRAKTRTRILPAGASLETGLGAAILLILLACLLLRGHLGLPQPMQADLGARFKPFGTAGHWFGTDQNGRDVMARVMAGLGWSLGCAASATAVAATIGTIAGVVASERAGWTRRIIMQSVSAMQAFPGIILAVSVIAILGHGFLPLVLTLGFIGWPVFARVTYAEAQSLYARPYVMAARLSGASRPAIIMGHILPGLRTTLLVLLAFYFADMLVAESAMSFLGLGAPLGTPTWGNMLEEGRSRMIQAPWLVLVPAVAIVCAVMAANLIGDGIGAILGRKQRTSGL